MVSGAMSIAPSSHETNPWVTFAVLRLSSSRKGAYADHLSSREVTSNNLVSPVEKVTRSIPPSSIFLEETSIPGVSSPA